MPRVSKEVEDIKNVFKEKSNPSTFIDISSDIKRKKRKPINGEIALFLRYFNFDKAKLENHLIKILSRRINIKTLLANFYSILIKHKIQLGASIQDLVRTVFVDFTDGIVVDGLSKDEEIALLNKLKTTTLHSALGLVNTQKTNTKEIYGEDGEVVELKEIAMQTLAPQIGNIQYMSEINRLIEELNIEEENIPTQDDLANEFAEMLKKQDEDKKRFEKRNISIDG